MDTNNDKMTMSAEAIAARRAYQQQWRDNNRDHVRAYNNQWRKDHPEKVATYQRTYWEKKARAAMTAEADSVGDNGKDKE